MQPSRSEMGRTARRAPQARRRAALSRPLTAAPSHAHACDSDAGIGFATTLLIVCDFACFALVTWITTSLHAPLEAAATAAITPARAAWIASVLGPLLLCDRRFGFGLPRLAAHSVRFALFVALALLVALGANIPQATPPGWLATFFLLAFVSTSLTRIVLARLLAGLRRHGLLREVVAIVGAGPLAERLVKQLRRVRPETTELLGIFDDDPDAAVSGTIDELIELGSMRRIDWIVLALPPSAESSALVQRLMALAAPVALCPEHVGLALARPVGYVAGAIPVTLLTDRPLARRDAVLQAMQEFVPRWVTTWIALLLAAASSLSRPYASPAPHDAQDVARPLLDHDVTALFFLCGHSRSRRSRQSDPLAHGQDAPLGLGSRSAGAPRQPLPRAPRDREPAPATLPPL